MTMAKRSRRRGKRVMTRQRFVTRRMRVDELVRGVARDEIRASSGRMEQVSCRGGDPVAVQWRIVRVAA